MLKFVRDVILIVGLIAVLFATMLAPTADGGAGEAKRVDPPRAPAAAAAGPLGSGAVGVAGR